MARGSISKSFTLIVFLVSLWASLENGAGLRCLAAFGRVAINKFGRKIRRSAENSQTRLGELEPDPAGDCQRQSRGQAFGMEDFEIRKFGEAANKLLRENMRWVRAAVITGPLMISSGPSPFRYFSCTRGNRFTSSA